MAGLPNDTGSLPNDAGGLPNSTGSASAAAFPLAVTLFAATYAPGAAGGPGRSDAAGVDCPANLRLDTARTDLPAYPDRGEADGAREYYWVELPGPGLATAPQLAAVAALRPGDRVVTAASNYFAAMTLSVVSQAVPVVPSRSFQLRCRQLA